MYNEDQKTAFLFSPELDNDFLQELYGEDLPQAEMVFESSVQQLHNGQQVMDTRFHDGDLEGLRKIVHKVKPLLGYMGMNSFMEEFASFEQKCTQFQTAAEAENGYEQIKAIAGEAIKMGEKEVSRLKQHNTQHL
ncbi:MAG: hypothetical protein H3C48_06470 [Chitinophagaceae bacterium]|nr:hypothetical protein [Chitinophagaceae bacterium]